VNAFGKSLVRQFVNRARLVTDALDETAPGYSALS